MSLFAATWTSPLPDTASHIPCRIAKLYAEAATLPPLNFYFLLFFGLGAK